MQVELQRQKRMVATISVVSNGILVVLKTVVGLMIGSVSVMSEAIHSGMDFAAAIIAWFAVRTSSQPADTDHPYGHGKVENISGTVEALLIFGAAVWIIYEAVHKLTHHAPMEAPTWGIAVMLFSAGANLLVSGWLFQVGHRTDSAALLADAWHLRTDVYTSAGVMVGLGIIWLGNQFLPELDLRWVDPVAAIFVALLILRAAYVLTVASGRDLLDARLPEEEEASIRDIVARFEPSAGQVHKLRTRKAGHLRFVEFHLKVNGQMSVEDSHRLSHQITGAIQGELAHATVNIHIEPRPGETKQGEKKG
jgi:cation diffusion facilitator family transporter